MSVREALFAARDEAAKAVDDYAATLRTEDGEQRTREQYTTEESVRYAELEGTVIRLDSRILEEDDKALRDEKVAAARTRLPIGESVVHSEPRTYSDDPANEHSYFLDGIFAHNALATHPKHEEALARQQRWGKEMVRDAVNDSVARARLIRTGREQLRSNTGMAARQFVSDVEARRGEVRAGMDTTASSGGSFVTPQYLVESWAAYRQFGRNFIDRSNKMPLPDYGMTVYIPHVTAASAVAAQAGQNQGVAETDPTAGYLSSNLTTLAGQVVISQQLLDRAGPGIEFDKIVFDSLQRNYAQTADAAVLSAALAQATGSVTNSNTGTSGQNVFQSFLSDIAQAVANMETTQPTVMSPTHVFCSATEFAYLSTQLDAYGRPYISVNGSNTPLDNDGDTWADGSPEGDTGVRVGAVPIIKDSNLTGSLTSSPVDSEDGLILVANMPELWVWEGELVPRTIPQTFAQNLSILLQVYTYYTVILRYSAAVQVISGERYPASPTFLQQ